MKIAGLIRWFLHSVLDKLYTVLSVWERSDELQSAEVIKSYCENFLNDPFYPQRTEKIWRTLFNADHAIIDLSSISKIYRLNCVVFSEWTQAKVEYYVRNHFWKLLDFFEIDTWSWDDKDVFGASLVTYAAYTEKNDVLILLTHLKD